MMIRKSTRSRVQSALDVGCKTILFFLPFVWAIKWSVRSRMKSWALPPFLSMCFDCRALPPISEKRMLRRNTWENGDIPYLRTNSSFFLCTAAVSEEKGSCHLHTIMQCGRPVSVDCTIVTWKFLCFKPIPSWGTRHLFENSSRRTRLAWQWLALHFLTELNMVWTPASVGCEVCLLYYSIYRCESCRMTVP